MGMGIKKTMDVRVERYTANGSLIDGNSERDFKGGKSFV